jgi:hypothetical protein
MKQLLILLLTLIFVPAVQSQNSPEDFAIRETFIQCDANHWKGAKTAPIKGTDQKVWLYCNRFWEAENSSYHTPSPFLLLTPGDEREIPFSVWNSAIEEILKITQEPK